MVLARKRKVTRSEEKRNFNFMFEGKVILTCGYELN